MQGSIMTKHKPIRVALSVILSLAFIIIADNACAQDRDAARAAFRRGSQHYKLGEYREALADFKAAYRNFEESTFLFNIAQCLRQLDLRADAIRAYRMYLSDSPDSDHREEVKELIAKLERELVDERSNKAAPRPTVLPLAPTERGVSMQRSAPVAPAPSATLSHSLVAAAPAPLKGRSRTLKRAGIGIGATGVALVVGGIAFGVLAKNAGNELSRNDMNQLPFDPARERNGELDEALAVTCFAVGSVALATGIVLYTLGRRSTPSRALAWAGRAQP
jgi:tetratricopeptide (TPR) repeat protein